MSEQSPRGHEGPEDIKKAIQEQVPHSGVHHGERPVYDFKHEDGSDMTIAEAMEAGLIHPAPESLGDYQEPSSSAPNEAYAPLHKETSSAETDTTPGRKRRNILIGAGTAVAGLAAVAGFAMGSSDDKEAPLRPTEAASAPATPGGEQSPATDEKPAPSTAEGESTTESPLDQVEGRATPEQIEYAMNHKIMEDDFPTADAAVVEMGKMMNVFFNSGQAEPGDGLTTETEQQGRQILDNFLSPAIADRDEMIDRLSKRRVQMANSFFLSYDGLKPNYKLEPQGEVEARPDGTYAVQARSISSGNFAGVLRDDMAEAFELDFLNEYVLIKSDEGQWMMIAGNRIEDLGNIE